MDVLVVGGAGTIGSTVAYTLTVRDPAVDVTLVDPRTDAAEGHAIDLRHATRHVAHPVGRPDFERSPPGSVRAAAPAPDLVDAADCVVLTASAPRPSGGDRRGGRRAFLEANRGVVDDVAGWLGAGEPTPVVVVTNPVDRIVHRLWRQTGWPRRCFLGYSLSETARVADVLARVADVSPAEVYCPVVGEHGEHVVPVFSRATVSGEPLELTERERRDALEYVRDVAYDVLALRGPDDSSRWVTGRGVAAIVERLGDGAADGPVCLSTPLRGEYGLSDVSVSVPVELGPDGVAEIVEWSLADAERDRLEEAARAIRADA